jgi:hypothetical protein
VSFKALEIAFELGADGGAAFNGTLADRQKHGTIAVLGRREKLFRL